jgi:hypothetical protein
MIRGNGRNHGIGRIARDLRIIETNYRKTILQRRGNISLIGDHPAGTCIIQ